MEITLRPYEANDVDDFMAWANDGEVIRLSRLTHYPSRAHALDYLLQVAIPHPWYRAICLEGRPIGFICLDPMGPGPGRCRGLIGFALGCRYWGQGIMTVAVKMAVKAVLAEIKGLERVEAVTEVDNKASQKVLEKAGFLREGVLRKYMVIKGKPTDLVMFSFLSDDLDLLL